MKIVAQEVDHPPIYYAHKPETPSHTHEGETTRTDARTAHVLTEHHQSIPGLLLGS